MRVLHIFTPGYRSRFSGPIIQWRYHFTRWQEPGIVHLLLDTTTGSIMPGTQGLNFQWTEEQKMPSRWERFKWIFSLLWNLIRLRKEYDVLHVHVLWWGTLLLGPLGKLGGVPTLYESVLQDADDPSSILKETFGRLKLRLLQSYTAILAISDALAEDYLQHGFSVGQVFMQMNSVDTLLFRPAVSRQEKILLRQKYTLPGDDKIGLFVGSLIFRKGVDILVEAFANAAAPVSNLSLVIVGAMNTNENPSLEKGFVNKLIEFLRHKGVEDRVSFLGLIQSREQLAELYRASDCFLFPSRSEGFGLVLLEAMASGLPVVSSQLPVLEKVINHRENGLFVPIADASALSEAILQLCADPTLAERLAWSGRAYVEKQHSFHAWQDSMIQIYLALSNRLAGL